MDLAIVVVGYNRPESLKRLLWSLNNAVIDERIPLIISLDHYEDKSCEIVSNEFIWKYGDKQVVTHSTKMGLKEHILECGSYTETYENILLLEDDLYVSPYFLSFIRESIEKYNGSDRIAGFGLYNYTINKSNPYRFEAIDDGYDAYFIQFACSWGQVWCKEKWNKYYEWYKDNCESFVFAKGVPQCVCNWDSRSWLKYYVRYCVEKDLYFVYPRISLVTDFSDVGTHAAESSSDFQVPILMGEKEWILPVFDEAKYKYDVFFENQELYSCLGVPKGSVLVDLYGVRANDKEDYTYWLTTCREEYKVLRSFGLQMRPRDLNIILNVPGNGIFLYDLRVETDNKPSRPSFNEMSYHIGSVNTKELLGFAIYNTYGRIRKKIVELFR